MHVNIDCENNIYQVKIHGPDTWDVDYTLSHIIHPLLVEFRKCPGGVGAIKREDVPESLHVYYDEGDDYCKEAYLWVIDEMIWAFDPEWDEKYGIGTGKFYKNYSRRENGFRLFGKYLTTLWN